MTRSYAATVVSNGTPRMGTFEFPPPLADNVPVETEAFNAVDLFGNQNIVVRPQDPGWIHTIDRLKHLLR